MKALLNYACIDEPFIPKTPPDTALLSHGLLFIGTGPVEEQPDS